MAKPTEFYSNYQTIPEFVRGQEALAGFSQKAKDVKEFKEKTALIALDEIKSLHQEKELVRLKIRDLEEQGATDSLIIPELLKFSRIERQLETLAQKGNFMALEIGKRIQNLEKQRSELQSLINTWTIDFSVYDSGRKISGSKVAKRDSKIKEYETQISVISKQIDDLQDALKMLELIKNNDKSLACDKTLLQEINKLLSLAVETYKIRESCREALVERLKKNRETAEMLRQENEQLEISISSLDPRSVADTIISADIVHLLDSSLIVKNPLQENIAKTTISRRIFELVKKGA